MIFRSLLLAAGLLTATGNTAAGPAGTTLRVATFNVAMGLDSEGELAARLAAGDDPGLQALAGILHAVRPDVLLLNEFDFQAGVDAARLLQENYGTPPYPYHYSAPVNTGVDSGLDLDNDGELHGPRDAWGYGRFPGQYGMLVLSRFPLDLERLRSFQHFKWAQMPGALRPQLPDGTLFHSDDTWAQLRLSSKSHWDVPVLLPGGETLHLLASHPTPPVFDGPEGRNSRRNHDEIRLWVDYLTPGQGDYLRDDQGGSGGLAPGAHWVVVGDLNADPQDGDSVRGPVQALLSPALSDQACTPASEGAAEASRLQGGINEQHRGNPAFDTSDFNDRYTGNLRVDYAIASRSVTVRDCGVFWPATGQPGHELLGFTDHRLVWIDIEVGAGHGGD